MATLSHMPLDAGLFSAAIAPLSGDVPAAPPPDYVAMVMEGRGREVDTTPVLLPDEPISLKMPAAPREAPPTPQVEQPRQVTLNPTPQANLVWLDTGDSYLHGEPITLSKEDLEQVRSLVANALAAKHRELAERLASIYGSMHKQKRTGNKMQARSNPRKKPVRKVSRKGHASEGAAEEKA